MVESIQESLSHSLKKTLLVKSLFISTFLYSIVIVLIFYQQSKSNDLMIEIGKDQIVQAIKEGDYYQVRSTIQVLFESGGFKYLEVSNKNGYSIVSQGKYASKSEFEVIEDETGMSWGKIQFTPSYNRIAVLSIGFLVLELFLIFLSLYYFRKSVSNKIRNLVAPLSSIINDLEEITSKNLSTMRSESKDRYSLSSTLEIRLLSNALDSFLKTLEDRNKITIESGRNKAVAQTVQMLAHDVRKPFSMLQGVMSVLSNVDSLDTVESLTKQALPEINRAVDSVNGMIQDVMEVGSEGNLICEAVELEPFLASIISDSFKYLKEASIRFEYDFRDRNRLNIDPLKVSRVFSNILGNAAQAMDRIGEIWFRTEPQEGNLVKFTIGNSNSFIPEERLDSLFDAFFTSNKKGGTGLGLAIAKKIVEAHGGEIWCSSNKDKGTEFYFTLPTLPTVSQSVVSLPTSSHAIIQAAELAKSKEVSSAETSVFEKAIIDSCKGAVRVLIVDDEPLYISILREQLSSNPALQERIQVIEAGSGEGALELSRVIEFDLIILDVDMGPGNIDGFETLVRLRNQGCKSMICMHSNRGGPKYHRTAHEGGADLFISKTMPREHFLRMIYSTIGDPDTILGRASKRPTKTSPPVSGSK